MPIPEYYRSRRGRDFRIQRRHEEVTPNGVQYTLRAFLVAAAREGLAAPPSAEAVGTVAGDDLRDRLHRRQVVPTPEDTFDRLWQRLRLDLDGL